MKLQDYKNYRKYYVPLHFIYLPLLLMLEAVGIYQVGNGSKNRLTWMLFSLVIFLILYLAIMLRQHYILGLQDRLVRLEFKQRYFEIFNKRFDDVEFKEFLYKALHKDMSDDQIKRLIQK